MFHHLKAFVIPYSSGYSGQKNLATRLKTWTILARTKTPIFSIIKGQVTSINHWTINPPLSRKYKNIQNSVLTSVVAVVGEAIENDELKIVHECLTCLVCFVVDVLLNCGQVDWSLFDLKFEKIFISLVEFIEFFLINCFEFLK